MQKFTGAFIGVLLLILLVGKTYAAEKDLYNFLWLDPDKKVYVLQNKVYKRDKTVYFSAGYLKGLSSKYQKTSGFKLKGGFYFTEEWAFELFYNSYANSNNDTYETLMKINTVEPFVRRLNSSYGALGLWTPFYGKINTFNRIYYFDWSFGLGAAKVNAESNAQTAGNSNVQNAYTKESYTGGIGKTELRFHITRNVHTAIEYQNTFFKAAGPVRAGSSVKSWQSYGDLILSVGFSF